MGQGFMSRIILVHASRREKDVPPSKYKVDKSIEPYLIDTYRWLNEEFSGEMQLNKESAELIDFAYGKHEKIPDNRFLYYHDRRDHHLLKITMTLAACRRSRIITVEDIREANYILSETEKSMPEALGEYGLSPLASAKQKMVEFLQHAGQPVTDRVLWSYMVRDIRMVDYRNALSDLENSGKIKKVKTTLGDAYVYREQNTEAIADLLDKAAGALGLEDKEAEVVNLGSRR